MIPSAEERVIKMTADLEGEGGGCFERDTRWLIADWNRMRKALVRIAGDGACRTDARQAFDVLCESNESAARP